MARTTDSHKYAFDCVVAKINPRTYLEWGCGEYSTRWACEKVPSVVSIEHDAAWAERMRAATSSDIRVLHYEHGKRTAYTEIESVQDGSIDFVLIDGRNRVLCCETAMRILSPHGIAMIHDTEREGYRRGIALFPHVCEIFSELDQTILLSKSNASFAKAEKINDAGNRCTYRLTV